MQEEIRSYAFLVRGGGGLGLAVLVPTNVGFSVLVCIAVCRFSVRSIWFLVFVKSSNRFSDLVSDVAFGFVLFGLNGNKFIALDGLLAVFGFDRIVCSFAVLDDCFYGFAVSNRPQYPFLVDVNINFWKET